jgi:hypothetical protein
VLLPFGESAVDRPFERLDVCEEVVLCAGRLLVAAPAVARSSQIRKT